MDDGATLPPTLLLNRYRVEGLLGEGGLGTVVKAFDTRLKRIVAIKTLRRSGYSVAPELFRAMEERFAREAEAGSRMGVNPNLVTVFDLSVDTDRTQYLILEYVPGGTLADRIRRGPIPLTDALRLTVDAARGLMAAHEHSIVHRDIKPANIFIGEGDRAQVGDFGIAQIDQISGRTQTVRGHPGTPLYMSPEQVHSTEYVRPSSDQYSLGLVLFEMLTGTAYKRLEKHDADALLAQHPTNVGTLVDRMIATEPGGRFPGMASILDAIQMIISMPTPAPSTDSSTPPVLPPDDMVTRHETPAINLQPVPPVIDRPRLPSATVSASRSLFRPVAFGVGGIAFVAVATLAVLLTIRGNATNAATATPLSATSRGAATPIGQVMESTPAPLATTGAPSPATSISRGGTATISATTPIGVTGIPSQPVSASSTNAPPLPVTSLLAYLDGRVALPGETDVNGQITGDPVQVVGIDLSHNQPARLPGVTTPVGSRAVRLLWTTQGTYLATLIRQPTSGGFGTSLDLVVINVSTGKATTVGKGINTLAAWSPDGTTLVYGIISGREPVRDSDGKALLPFLGQDGKPITDNAYDIHLVRFDGTNDRVITHIPPRQGGGGRGGGCHDPFEIFLENDQFALYSPFETGWASNNSFIKVALPFGIYTMRPDGSGVGIDNADIRPTTSDRIQPKNDVQLQLVDDPDAYQWQYESGLDPGLIENRIRDGLGICKDNALQGTANAGYRNQIIARLADGTTRKLTSSPTFKYQVSVSPDGTAVAFTALTVSNYRDSVSDPVGYKGYQTDVYVVRLDGGSVLQLSTSGAGHHAAWERDIPVKSAPVSTPSPTQTPSPVPSLPNSAGDPAGRIRLRYPNGWVIKQDNPKGNVMELDGPDGIFVYISASARDRPYYDSIDDFKQARRTDNTRNYADGNDQSITLGSPVSPAKGLWFEYLSGSKIDGTDIRAGQVWYVENGDNLYIIEAYSAGTSLRHSGEVNAIVGSIVFLK